MRVAGLLLVYLFPVCLAVVEPAAEGAAGETEQAAATHTPWSGYGGRSPRASCSCP